MSRTASTARKSAFPRTPALPGSASPSGRAVNILDAYKDARFNPEIDRRTGFRTRSMLCMPIVARGAQVIGVMQILNRRLGAFGAADERRLLAFCAEAAVAIQNAQLFEDISAERNYNESILRSMSNAVLTLDADGVLRKVNEAAMRILRSRRSMNSSDMRSQNCLPAAMHGSRAAWTRSAPQARRTSRWIPTCSSSGTQVVSVDLTTVPLVSMQR